MQLIGDRVVLGDLAELAVAQQVGPRVADVDDHERVAVAGFVGHERGGAHRGAHARGSTGRLRPRSITFALAVRAASTRPSAVGFFGELFAQRVDRDQRRRLRPRRGRPCRRPPRTAISVTSIWSSLLVRTRPTSVTAPVRRRGHRAPRARWGRRAMRSPFFSRAGPPTLRPLRYVPLVEPRSSMWKPLSLRNRRACNWLTIDSASCTWQPWPRPSVASSPTMNSLLASSPALTTRSDGLAAPRRRRAVAPARAARDGGRRWRGDGGHRPGLGREQAEHAQEEQPDEREQQQAAGR